MIGYHLPQGQLPCASCVGSGGGLAFLPLHPGVFYLICAANISNIPILKQIWFSMSRSLAMFTVRTVREKIIWSHADFVRLPTDKEMISL